MSIPRKLKITVALIALVALFFSYCWILLGVVTILLLLSFGRIKEKKNFKFWLFFCGISFFPCLFIRTYEIFHLSLLVFCRSVILYLAILTITENINLNSTDKYFTKIIGKRLSILLTISFNLMPVLRNILVRNYALFYLRRSHNQKKLHLLFRYALSIFRQGIETADACAENMLLIHKVSAPHVVIITGDTLSGKTTLLTNFITQFKSKSWPVTGIVAPSTILNNRRSTIYVQDVRTNEQKLLASREEKLSDHVYDYGSFSFSKSGYEFASNALLSYVPGGIVVLDEFGPMEFAGIGYADEFKKLLDASVSALYVVVRKDILEKFCAEFNLVSYEIIFVKPERLSTEIIDCVERSNSILLSTEDR